MKSYLYILAVFGVSAWAQVPAQTYQYEVMQCPRCAVMPAPLNDPNYWNKLRQPYNQVQVVVIPVPAQLPTQNQVQSLPNQTEEQRRQMQNLVK